MKITFPGRLLVLGCGAVSQCFIPLVLRHFDMDFSRVTLMDQLDQRSKLGDALTAGMNFVQHQITPDNLGETLGTYVGAGDLLVDLAWNIGAEDIIQWCHDHDVLYINTSLELWDPYLDIENKPPNERTLYVRHMAMTKLAASWAEKGVTAVIEHGANPGLVSHWTKVGLKDIARTLLDETGKAKLKAKRRKALEAALDAHEWNRVAMQLGVKVIHVSERDTQISSIPKKPDEFVNTWSVEGFYEEGVAPAEMGWGTHEHTLPPGTFLHGYGPANQICLNRMGINTFVRSWVPKGGEIIGMVVRHGEAFTLSDYLTVWEDDKPIYRPTVHYAYQPTDAAIASLMELRGRNYVQQTGARIMNNDIIAGEDELGVLLLGHDLTGWWVGSQLDIHEARKLVPGQNATTLQVAASVLGAVKWMIENPREGLLTPEKLPHMEVLATAAPYLGPCPSVQTDWTPLKNRDDWFANFGRPRPLEADLWQFGTFLADI